MSDKASIRDWFAKFRTGRTDKMYVKREAVMEENIKNPQNDFG